MQNEHLISEKNTSSLTERQGNDVSLLDASYGSLRMDTSLADMTAELVKNLKDQEWWVFKR